MANIFKIKKYWIVTFCVVLFSLNSFAQDSTNGFDETRIAALLKSRGVSDKDLNRELNIAREQYKMMKKSQEEITAKLLSRSAVQKSEKRASVSRTAATLNTISDIPQSEKNALQAIYNSTNGANWVNNAGWNFSNPVVSADETNGWYGIQVIDGHVTSLVLSGNGLIGTLPAEIGNLSELYYLELSWNSLSNQIPSSIGNLTKLTSIWIQTNEFNGPIPTSIGSLPELSQLILSGNQLTGQIPSSFSTLPSIAYIGLEQNKLSKAIPDLSSLPLLYGLMIYDNNFTYGDFINQYDHYKNNLALFEYNIQSNTDTEETITAQTGNPVSLSMFTDGGSTPQDTYQWYKNEEAIPNAQSRVYTIPNAQSSDAGDYYCIAANDIITDLTLTRNPIHLTVTGQNCTPITAVLKSSLDQFCIDKESPFSLSTTTVNLTYNWTALTAAEVPINTINGDTTGTYKYTFTTAGNYIIKVEAIDAAGCRTTFTKIISVKECDLETTCVNQPINVTFETTASNINYNWYTVKEGTTQQLNPITNTTGSYTFTPTVSGIYTIYLKAYQNDQCQFEFHKKVLVDPCEPFVSCTKSNKNSPAIKAVFTTLVNKLISLPAQTITDGYTCDELAALAFYIKDENPAIYNFVHDTQQGFIAFSFSDHAEYDVKIATNGNVAANFNLDNFESNTIVTEIRTDTNDAFESYINHIDFCSPLFCTSHIAFVVDESGSIDDTEASKIRTQLKNYVQQQADDNDKLKTEVYISLIGMSDGDDIIREDHVLQLKATNIGTALTQFNSWIDNYRLRNGKKPGITASSDYWKSGLDAALSTPIKPSAVIMITDGCETSNVEALRTTMSHFSNSRSTADNSPDKPHLYVIGIEDGFYVDGGLTSGSLMALNGDPNYQTINTQSTSDSRVVPKLTTSLKYLLSMGETEYPRADLNNFRDYDYYGYENFNSLGTSANKAFLSDNLKLSGFSCGSPTDKNYCSDCLSFQPFPGKEYMLSAWVKEESFIQVKTYENAIINVIYYSDVDTSELHRISTQKLFASGDIIDGWQRIVGKFLIPNNTKTIGIELENSSNGTPVYFDDLRIHPLEGSVKTFVYDSETFKLMSELDENNYSTFYEYDNEGGLIRVKKETAKGIKTIQETRSGNFINTTQN